MPLVGNDLFRWGPGRKLLLVGNDSSVGAGVHTTDSLGFRWPKGIKKAPSNQMLWFESVSTNPHTISFLFCSGCDEYPVYFTNVNTRSVDNTVGWA